MAGAVAPNFVNRTMWTRDNLDVLRGLNSKTVDLVYADPPFNIRGNSYRMREHQDWLRSAAEKRREEVAG